LVALAFTGGIPTNNSVGKEMKLPPPATELMAPAEMAAASRIGQCAMCIRRKLMLLGNLGNNKNNVDDVDTW
jgi:hypothetical protein